MRVFLLLYPYLLGLVIFVWPEKILKSTERASDNVIRFFSSKPIIQYPFDVWVLIFWIFTIGWIIIQTIVYLKERNSTDADKKKNEDDRAENEKERIKNEAERKTNEAERIKNNEERTKNENRHQDLQEIIHNAPNKEVFSFYVLAYNDIYDSLKWLSYHSATSGKTKDRFISTFQAVLEKICLITSTFKFLPGATYCVNIMPYLDASNDNTHLIDELKKNKALMLFDEVNDDDYIVKGVLLGNADIVYTSGRKIDDIPIINLPLVTKNSKGVYIPGACYAVKERQAVVNSTDLNKKTLFDKLDDPIKNAARRFFEGKGKDIKSIVSFSIPYPEKTRDDLIENSESTVLGVLNIDCNKEDIIGSVSKYYETFFALIRPIINQLSPELKNYLDFLAENEKV